MSSKKTSDKHQVANSIGRRGFLNAAGVVALGGMVGVGIPVIAKTHAQTDRHRADKLNDRLYFLTVNGSAYQRGFQHGQALKYVIQSGMARWRQFISEVLEESDPEIEIAEFVHGTDFLGAIKNHTPDLYLELQGIAAGAQVDFNNLYAYNMFDEFIAFTKTKYRLTFCTGFGVYGRENLPNMIGQNNDLPTYFDGTQTLLRIKQDDGFDTYVFTFAGLLANNGLNSSALGCTINIMPSKVSGDLAGLPMPYVVRGILQRRSRQEAIKFLKEVKVFAGPMNYIIGDPTGVSTVETGKDFFKVHETFKGEKYVPHANHPLDLSHEMKPGEVSKSIERQNKLVELIGGRSDKIDAIEARKIFRSRPILKNYETDPNFPTLESVIIECDPDNPRIQIAPGPPDRYKYISFDFEKGFVGSEE